MIADETEIFVLDGTLLEIQYGEHITVSRTFGEDWQSAPLVQIHPSSLRPAAPVRAGASEPQPQPQTKKANNKIWICAVIVLAALSAAAILYL